MSILNHHVVSKATNLSGYISKTRLDKVYVTFVNGAAAPISIYNVNDYLYLSDRTKKAIDKQISKLSEANKS